jgi:glycerophosphoryl diester phosphodiesterase
VKKKKIFKKIILAFVVIAVIVATLALYFTFNTTVGSKFTVASATKKEFYLTAHRGLSAIAPENTAPAIEEAGKAGFYAAEFDVMPTKDGVWVLIHDDTVDRTMDGEGEVEKLTLAQLREMKIDGGKGIENYPDLRISTLEEAIDICIEYSMRPMIEVKGGTPEDMQSVLDIINSKGIKDTAIVIDFDKDRLSALRALDDEIELWHLTNKITDETMEFVKKSNAGIGFNFGIPQNYFYINDAKREGITLASWTVDIPFVVDVLNAAGVDYITTNKIMP